jgi:hypothetical protein
MLRNRVRTITDGAVDLTPASSSDGPPAAVVDGRAFFQTSDVRGLGPALRWARSNDADRLCLIAEAAVAPDLARRAGLLDAEIEVWSADGPNVHRAESAPVPRPPELAPEHLRFASLIAEAGARALDDHGMLIAEVAGLEVARVTNELDPADDEVRLAVGVGQADRELQQYIHGHLDDDANLRRAIGAVVRERRPGAGGHPLTRLGRQRWLRSVLLDDPGLVGLTSLEAVAPLRRRETLLGGEPAAALGHDELGNQTVVVCSVGVDLDLLPEAADYRLRDAPDARLLIVVPERDRALAAVGADWLPGIEVASIPSPWEPIPS